MLQQSRANLPAHSAPSSSSYRAHFAREGFLVVDSFAERGELEEIRALLDPLFARFASISRKQALDLAAPNGVAPRIPDINHARRLEPLLNRTAVFGKARALARQILGPPVFCVFDHAIYKPPRNSASTPWHQDQAYAGFPHPLTAVHLWIPLQPATKENGCMWFVPKKHHDGVLPHERVEGTTATLQVQSFDESHAVCCPVPCGGATVHSPLTLHMTGANCTSEPRKAWIIHFARFGLLGQVHPRNLAYRLSRSIGR